MSPLFLAMPDVEAAASQILRDAGHRAYSSIPNGPTYPLLVVTRIGGVPAERHKLDAARIQVDAWGNNKGEARDLADLARRLIHQAEGTFITDHDCQITGVEDELGLSFLPDPKTKRDRYVFTVRIYAHNRTV